MKTESGLQIGKVHIANPLSAFTESDRERKERLRYTHRKPKKIDGNDWDSEAEPEDFSPDDPKKFVQDKPEEFVADFVTKHLLPMAIQQGKSSKEDIRTLAERYVRNELKTADDEFEPKLSELLFLCWSALAFRMEDMKEKAKSEPTDTYVSWKYTLTYVERLLPHLNSLLD